DPGPGRVAAVGLQWGGRVPPRPAPRLRHPRGAPLPVVPHDRVRGDGADRVGGAAGDRHGDRGRRGLAAPGLADRHPAAGVEGQLRDADQRLGSLIGIPQLAFDAWNIVKWPILLVILIIGVSLAYYLFPNVRLPRYRLMTLGSTLSVLVLFASAL